jgi:hypothetical protein
MIKAWLQFPEHISQLPVENPGANLQQQVSAFLRQRICCFLTIRLLYDLTDGRYCKRGSDGLSIPITIGAIWDESCIVSDIGLKFFYLLHQYLLLFSGIFSKDISKIAHGLDRKISIPISHQSGEC